jgi:NAD(P)-dependent dehydrogenase (short-subunit alcohol dehydrogenase family)
MFGAMQERFPSIAGVAPQEMAELQTLGEVADYIQIKTGAGAYDAGTPSSDVLIKTNQSIKRCEVKFKYLPQPDFMEITLSEGYTTLLVNDGSDLTTDVADLLLKQGSKVAVLSLPEDIVKSKNTLPEGVTNIILDNTSDECIKSAVARIDNIGSFIHLHPYFEVTDENFSRFHEKDKAIVKTVFLIAKYLKQPLEKAGKTRRACFITVARLDGEFGLGDSLKSSPFCGGLFGLTKTLNLEWQSVFCRAVDLDPNLKPSAQLIISEMHDPDSGLIEVGHSQHRGRQTIVANEVSVDKSSLQKAEISPSSVFLVSGGGRGVTAECAIKLAEAYKSRFILLGRSSNEGSEPDWARGCSNEKELKKLIMQDFQSRGEKPTLPEIQKIYNGIISNREIHKTLQAIKEAGGEAVYLAANVTDASSLRRVLPDAIKQMGSITGIIHGAGRLADKYIEDKTEADFEAVYSVKTEGLLALLNCVPIFDLKHLVLFSSVAGFYGNVGQSDYAIANETLNKTALFIKKLHPSCHVSAINWGPWDSGMVRPELKKLFEENNIELIPTDVGTSMFVDEMSLSYKDQSQVVIGNALPFATSYISEEFKTYRIHRKLTLEANPFLIDHTIGDHPVVPIVSAVGWMSHACEQIYPDFKVFSCEDNKLFKGIVFDGKHTDNYILDLEELKKNKDEINFKVLIWSHGSNGSTGKTISHYSSVIKLLKSIPDAPVYQNGVKKSGSAHEISSDELYRNGTLFHGPTFQGIKKVSSLTPEKIVLECQLPPVSEEAQGQFPMHTVNTLLTDMQYQAMLVWVKHFQNAASLPLKTERAEFYKTIPFDKKFYISVDVKASNNYKMVADISTYDENDRLYIQTQGAEVTLMQ